MTKNLSAKVLIPTISKIFLEQDRYQMDKNIIEFTNESKYIGDYFNFVIFELHKDKAPTFYHVASPFDLISKKIGQQALVFENGKLLLNIDFVNYALMRTGVMDSLLLKNLGVNSLIDKNVLYFGSGNISKWSLRFLKEIYPELTRVDFINKSGKNNDFMSYSNKLKVKASSPQFVDIGKYDYIFCHTNSTSSILNRNDLQKIKPGTVITSTISSTEHGELADEFFNSNMSNIITDWPASITSAKELKRTIENKSLEETKIIFLKDLLSGKRKIDQSKKYTIYRSTGTPMQNLAVLKLLLK